MTTAPADPDTGVERAAGDADDEHQGDAEADHDDAERQRALLQAPAERHLRVELGWRHHAPLDQSQPLLVPQLPDLGAIAQPRQDDDDAAEHGGQAEHHRQ